MSRMRKQAEGLLEIPGVGPSISADLIQLGFSKVTDLAKANPEKMYDSLIALRGKPIDRCVLYVFRCAVYYASNDRHDPDLLKWWNWKDRTLATGE